MINFNQNFKSNESIMKEHHALTAIVLVDAVFILGKAWNIKTLLGKPLKLSVPQTTDVDTDTHEPVAHGSAAPSKQNNDKNSRGSSSDGVTSATATSVRCSTSQHPPDDITLREPSDKFVARQKICSLADKRQQIQCTFKRFKRNYQKEKDSQIKQTRAASVNHQLSKSCSITSTASSLCLPDNEAADQLSITDELRDLCEQGSTISATSPILYPILDSISAHASPVKQQTVKRVCSKIVK